MASYGELKRDQRLLIDQNQKPNGFEVSNMEGEKYNENTSQKFI